MYHCEKTLFKCVFLEGSLAFYAFCMARNEFRNANVKVKVKVKECLRISTLFFHGGKSCDSRTQNGITKNKILNWYDSFC